MRPDARGFRKWYNVDFDETFAPTASSSSVMIIAVFAKEYDRRFRRRRGKQAFMKARLDYDISRSSPLVVVPRVVESSS